MNPNQMQNLQQGFQQMGLQNNQQQLPGGNVGGQSQQYGQQMGGQQQQFNQTQPQQQYGQQQMGQQYGQQQMGGQQQQFNQTQPQQTQPQTQPQQQFQPQQRQQQQPQQQQQQQQNFDPEQRDGLRWNWNVLPSTKADQEKMTFPIAANYTILRKYTNRNLPYDPVCCSKCNGILNPYAGVDYASSTWTCPLCFNKNLFPQSYSGISPQNQPAEIRSDCTTVEYTLSQKFVPERKPVLLFVVDTCLPSDELEYLRESLTVALNCIPEDCVVGLITYGTTVQLYELGYSSCSKAYVFRGDKAPTLEQVQKQLGLHLNTMQGTQPQTMQTNVSKSAQNRFLIKMADADEAINAIIDELQSDPWVVKPHCRSRRCTGVALSVATSLLESSYKGQGARILLFAGGPCTMGDGLVVGLPFKETLRLHNDLNNGSAKHAKAATTYYQKLTERLVCNGHCVDCFVGHLDQVGTYEMRSLFENTGGTLVHTDTFQNPVFKESLDKYFETNDNDQLLHSYNAQLEVQTSPEMKICGALGPVASINKKHRCVSETEVGYGKTNAWKINSLDEKTTVTVFFDVVNQSQGVGSGNQARFFQFVCSYQHPSGEQRLRVTTTALRYAQPNNLAEIGTGFDQVCQAVVTARMAVFKAQTEYLYDVMRWIDRSLIKLVSQFGHFQPKQPQTLQLPQNFQAYPQFMYHLRRSPFLRLFNTSPDETTFYKVHLNRAPSKDCMAMIQPLLYSYSYGADKAVPVLLDSVNVKNDVVLVLDTYFLILIYTGEKIAFWRSKNYQEQEAYAPLKKMLEEPKKQVMEILKNRFPYPRYLESDEGGSQARHLLAKVNPSTTHRNQNYGGGQQGNVQVLTEDASLNLFLSSLKQLAVNSGKSGNNQQGSFGH